jgi:Platelet-activating factor acetylhydrolase, isoform II
MAGIRAIACATLLCLTTMSWDNPANRPGIYKVGFTSFVVSDPSRHGRPIPLSVFYPVSPSDINSSSTPAAYPRDPVNRPFESLSSQQFEALGVDPAYEMPVPSHRGPFPLVVFSPGLNNHATHYVYLAARLASHGYVVALLSHPGESSPVRVVMNQRALDMSFALTELLERSEAAGDLLYQTMDSKMIVSAGHSIGGYAAIVMTSGDDNVCNPVPVNPQPPGVCVGIARDPRFVALATLDPSNFLLTFEELELVGVPSIDLGRDAETNLAQRGPYGAASLARAHAAFSGLPKYRVDVVDSRHGASFTNVCEFTLVELAAGLITQAAADATFATFECYRSNVIAPTEAHRIVTAYMVSFLNKIADRHDEDRGENSSQRLLEPEWAARHEPYVRLFLTEEGGPETALRNIGSPQTFQYFWTPPRDLVGVTRFGPATAAPRPVAEGPRRPR